MRYSPLRIVRPRDGFCATSSRRASAEDVHQRVELREDRAAEGGVGFLVDQVEIGGAQVANGAANALGGFVLRKQPRVGVEHRQPVACGHRRVALEPRRKAVPRADAGDLRRAGQIIGDDQDSTHATPP